MLARDGPDGRPPQARSVRDRGVDVGDCRRTSIDEVVADDAVEVGEVVALDSGDPRECGHDVDEARIVADDAALTDPCSREQEGRSRLDHVERSVLSVVSALVGEVVRRGVDDGEVRCSSLGEEGLQSQPGQGVCVAVVIG